MSTQHSAWYGLLIPCSRLHPIDFLPLASSVLCGPQRPCLCSSALLCRFTSSHKLTVFQIHTCTHSSYQSGQLPGEA